MTVPIAFVSEHLETLYDMDILAREAAPKAGAALYLRVPALGTRPDFIAALADVVRRGGRAGAGGPGRAHGWGLIGRRRRDRAR